MSGLFNSFDDEELDGGAQAEDQQDPVDELFDAEEELDEEMVEAEKRITLAGYYQRLARGGIFKDGSDEARIVDTEVRQFARERMSVLLGLPSAPKSAPKPQAELPFSEEQLDALRQWADRIIERQHNGGQPQMSSPKPPQLPAAAPQQRTTQPVITPVAPPPTMAKPRKGALDVQARRKTPQPQQRKRNQKQDIDQAYANVPDLQPFEVDGVTYKWVRNPDTNERVRLKVNTAKQVGATGQHPGRLPTLSEHAAAAMSASKAAEDLETTPAAKNQTIQAAAALSILKE